MLQEAIEKNRMFLRVCAVVAVLSGAVSIAFAVYMVAAPLYSFEWRPLKPQQVYYIFSYAHKLGRARGSNVELVFVCLGKGALNHVFIHCG